MEGNLEVRDIEFEAQRGSALSTHSEEKNRHRFVTPLRRPLRGLESADLLHRNGDAAMNASWMPRGFHTITPNIVVNGAEEAVAFLKKAFGFVENFRLTTSSGEIAHCELKLGDSVVNVGEAMAGFPSCTLLAQIYVQDADQLFERSVQAGATILMPMTDMFFGSREGRVSDPFGNVWTIATLREAVEPDEMQRRMADAGY